jgi:acetyl-CoA carboxylase carboxyl transferase subunit beta
MAFWLGKGCMHVDDETVDRGSWRPQDEGLVATDPLAFPGYREALLKATDRTGATESVRAGSATISGHEVEFAAFDFSFLGGSMGEATGERIARALERAAERQVPFVLRTETGGARMQEGMRALIQMPKLVVARQALARAHQPFIAVFSHPTTGGVLASLGALADVIVAETGATVGFAGPRVAARATGHDIGPYSHRSESALTAGLVDDVLDPEELHAYLVAALDTLCPDQPIDVEEIEEVPATTAEDPWAVVEAARSEQRPLAHELLLEMADSYIALRGDRAGQMDPAVDVAVVRIAGRRALVLAMDRGRAPGPAAYRKAIRAIQIAERLRIPVVSIVDTGGADPSEDSEAGGIAWAIAELFQTMLATRVPTLAIVTGEGGSGGALAFATTDVLLAYEDSIFSVIGPELAAEILWRDGTRGPDAARILRLTAGDLYELGIADGLLEGPPTARSLRSAIAYHLGRLSEHSTDELIAARYKRWRGSYGN